MKFGLQNDVIDQVLKIFSMHPQIKKAIIYGSRAKGNFKPSSDVDITLVGEDVTLEVLNKVNWQLDDLMLPYTFDLSIHNHIKQSDLLDHIKRVGVTLYNK